VRIRPQDRVLDWKPRFDERSRNFRLTVEVEPARVRRLWRQGIVLNQGAEGACVGFGWTGTELNGPQYPVQPPRAVATATALRRYNEAKTIDEWPGEAYSGTSVLAGAKVMQTDGVISEYRWCFGIADVRRALLTHGPVVIGVPWYSEMYETRIDGTVKMGGELVGGHCLFLNGYHPAKLVNGTPREMFRWRNSWGSSYGINGSAWIATDDLASLLADQGESCIPTKVA
jgi:hypothetical protein